MTTQVPDAERWNHTIAYWRDLLPLAPDGHGSALDVGCGEGFASRSLAARGLDVTGIDLDEPSIARARAQGGGPRYEVADAMRWAEGPYDVVASLATLHHLDLDAGLARLRGLVAPGGVLLVVGLAASELPRDAARELAAFVGHRARTLRARPWDHGSPTVWPPPHTYRDVHDGARRALPGAEFRRRLLWRYTIVWRAPES